MDSLKRILAAALALAVILGVCSFAMAAGVTAAPAATTPLVETLGEVEVDIVVTNNDAAQITVARAVKQKGVISGVSALAAPEVVSAGGSAIITFTVQVDTSKAPNIYADNIIRIYYLDGAGTQKYVDSSAFSIYKSSEAISSGDTGTAAEPSTEKSYVRLSPIDAGGNLVPAASGNYGERIHVRIPLVSDYYTIGSLKITPVITTDVETFPFDLTLVDYTAAWPGYVRAGEIAEFTYDFTLSKKATAGIKKVDFNVSFTDPYNNLMEGVVSVYINVKKGASPEGGAAEALGNTRLLIEPSVKPASEDNKVYAGEVFSVQFDVRNISSSSVKNVIMKLNDESGVLLPANNGTNTVYIEKIPGGETQSVTVSMQASSDAEPKAYTLTASVIFDGSATPTEQSVTVPVSQRIRLKFDDPVIYDEGWVGSSVAMYTAMYNLGKSGIFNCMVDVEGEGLKIEETYFGGNVSSGGTMRADFNVIPSAAGEIQGNVIVSYEDAAGTQYEEKLPFTLFVNEMQEFEDPYMGEGMVEMEEPANTGNLKWLWALSILPVGAGVFFLIKGLKKKRARELTEIEESDI